MLTFLVNYPFNTLLQNQTNLFKKKNQSTNERRLHTETKGHEAIKLAPIIINKAVYSTSAE